MNSSYKKLQLKIEELNTEINSLNTHISKTEERLYKALKPRYTNGWIIYLLGCVTGITFALLLILIKSFLILP